MIMGARIARIFLSLLGLLLYGFSCYQMGRSMELTSLRSSNPLDSPPTSTDPLVLQKHGLNSLDSLSSLEHSFIAATTNETLARLYHMSKSTRTSMVEKKIEEHKETWPYKCGVVMFYHVPCTGGMTINKWLMQFKTEDDNGNSNYLTHWGAGKRDKKVVQELVEQVEENFIKGMNQLILNIPKNEWRIAHAHINSLHLNVSEPHMFQWRRTVEQQGCHFIANVMFRNPLSHALSLHKHQAKCCSRDEWSKHFNSPSEQGHWTSQLDFFLYSKITRNPHGVSTKEKVNRAMQLLQRHFDLVMVGDHDRYKKILVAMTGWEDKRMIRANSYFGKLDFSKEEVQKIQKVLEGSGDEDFMSQVKLLYRDSYSQLINRQE